ncbi:MAG: 50S ribosomal protein L9 [Cyanobacteria bacterium P01_D01_bin.105]
MARKKTQVVLSQDIPKLGNNGDLVEVAPGYARNFLIPRSMAYRVTPGVLKQVEIRRERERQRLEAIKQEAEATKTALNTIGLFTIAKAVGEDDAIFGTVTAAEVADLIQTNAGKEVDRRDITIPDINKLGEYKVDVKLHSEVTATLNLRVVAD